MSDAIELAYRATPFSQTLVAVSQLLQGLGGRIDVALRSLDERPDLVLFLQSKATTADGALDFALLPSELLLELVAAVSALDAALQRFDLHAPPPEGMAEPTTRSAA